MVPGSTNAIFSHSIDQSVSESYILARDFVYSGNSRREFVKPLISLEIEANGCQDLNEGDAYVYTPSDAYMQRLTEISYQRIAHAGYNLAFFIHYFAKEIPPVKPLVTFLTCSGVFCRMCLVLQITQMKLQDLPGP